MNDIFVPRFSRRCEQQKPRERTASSHFLTSKYQFSGCIPYTAVQNEEKIKTLLSRLSELSIENRALKTEVAVLLRMKETTSVFTTDSAVQTNAFNDYATSTDYRASDVLFDKTEDFRVLQARDINKNCVSYVSDADLGVYRWVLEMRGYSASDLDLLDGLKLSECGCCVDSFRAEY